MCIRDRPHVDFIFPPAGRPGSNQEYTVYGRHLPGGQNSPYRIGGQVIQQLKARIAIPGNITDQLRFPHRLEPHQAGLDGLEYRVNSPAGMSNPILVSAALMEPIVESRANDSPGQSMELKPPCEISGQFYPRRDQDWFRFNAKKGEELWFTVYSHRLGLPTDPRLLIQRVTTTEAGEEQVSQVAMIDDVTSTVRGKEFDHRTRDPSYRFNAPADGLYRVLLTLSLIHI